SSMLYFLSMPLSLLILLEFIQPSPTTTLFPYTTLFRSGRAQQQTRFRSPSSCWKKALSISDVPDVPDPRLLHREVQEFIRAHVSDRKSTRLNSSHVKFSYAVFCLKKKRSPEN